MTVRAKLAGWIALLGALACAPETNTTAKAAATVPPVEHSRGAELRPPTVEPAMLAYPSVRRDSVIDEYHGVRVADPYRWLEDVDSPETRAFIEAENKLTFSYLRAIPERDHIERRLTKLWDFERFGVPIRRGQNTFYTKNSGLQNQAVLYVKGPGATEPRILLDPNALSSDGTVALDGTSPSNSGKFLAYGLATAGSDWTEWRVKNVATGVDLGDRLEWIRFSEISWTHDDSGFFYSRFPEPTGESSSKAANYYNKSYFHRLGTPQSDDVLVAERPDQKEWMFGADVTDDGRYLVVTVAKSTDDKQLVFYSQLGAGRIRRTPALTPIITKFESEFAFLGNQGDRFWFKTTAGAARGRIIAIDLRHPEPEHWREVVPEAPDALHSVSWVGERLVATYLKDAHSEVEVFDVNGRFEHALELPGLGTVTGFSGKQTDPDTFFSYTSFTTPSVIYRYEPKTNRAEVYAAPRLAFDPSQYESRQVFVTSKDGTKIPVFLSARKGQTGPAPAYLYGYGGFDISITPAFDVAALAWMEMGGLYAVANLRGGGEYGEAWHEAGKKLRKQNVFDDFIAAAEWLVENGYTTRKRLAIGGRSNGGLLIGACVTERPDLFGAALPAVGVMDMLRYQEHTIGWAWADEYGTVADPDEFRALFSYSPLQNVKPGTRYPAILVTTGDHDDRVVPSHSFKFAAALQAAQAGPAPVLLRVETRAGHGAGTPLGKKIAEEADRWAFLVKALGPTPLPGRASP